MQGRETPHNKERTDRQSLSFSMSPHVRKEQTQFVFTGVEREEQKTKSQFFTSFPSSS